MAWTYQTTLTLRAPSEYKCGLSAVKKALREHGYMFSAFRPPRIGEEYLSVASLSIATARLDFPERLPRLIVVPITSLPSIDTEWNS